MTEKVAIYCRLSEEDRGKQNKTDESGSIQNQKAMLLRYRTEQGWDVYRIYSDDDYTGADRNRPAFCSLLKDAEAGKFHIVLCKSQSRFTREMELVEKYIHGLFPLWGIRFVSIVDNADTLVGGAADFMATLNESDIQSLVASFKTLLENINDPDGSIRKLLVDGSIYDSVDDLLNDIDILVKEIQENPKKYIKISVF